MIAAAACLLSAVFITLYSLNEPAGKRSPVHAAVAAVAWFAFYVLHRQP